VTLASMDALVPRSTRSIQASSTKPEARTRPTAQAATTEPAQRPVQTRMQAAESRAIHTGRITACSRRDWRAADRL
jgi:hypothetical protein